MINPKRNRESSERARARGGSYLLRKVFKFEREREFSMCIHKVSLC